MQYILECITLLDCSTVFRRPFNTDSSNQFRDCCLALVFLSLVYSACELDTRTPQQSTQYI